MAGKRPGRPVKRPVEGKKNQVGLSLTATLKRRLDAEAFRQGRTLADEVETRLETTFLKQDLLAEVLGLAYGPQTAALLMIIGDALERLIAPIGGGGPDRRMMAASRVTKADWLNDPDCFAAAEVAMHIILKALQPTGELERGPLGKIFGEFTAVRTFDLLAEAPDPRWAAIRTVLPAAVGCNSRWEAIRKPLAPRTSDKGEPK